MKGNRDKDIRFECTHRHISYTKYVSKANGMFGTQRHYDAGTVSCVMINYLQSRDEIYSSKIFSFFLGRPKRQLERVSRLNTHGRCT